MATPQEDSELVKAWQRGDQAAAGALVKRHAPALGRYIRSRGVASADLDDMIQEVFIKAFRGLDGWRGEGAASLRGWLFRIALNHLRDAHRRGGRMPEVEILDADVAVATNPLASLEAMEVAGALAARLVDLSPMQRQVFRLRIEAGLSYREIGVALVTTEGAARVHFHHALKRLREVLQ